MNWLGFLSAPVRARMVQQEEEGDDDLIGLVDDEDEQASLWYLQNEDPGSRRNPDAPAKKIRRRDHAGRETA